MKVFSREIEIACQLARQAGQTVLEHYRSDFTVDYKNDDPGNPVTQADRRANALIVDGLARAFPQDAILAEESADPPDRQSFERLWCVDPVDGTREFVARNDQFVVMIGLAIAGEARLGVVLQPTTDLLYWGAENEAWLETAQGRQPLRVSVKTDMNAATMVVSRARRSRLVERAAESLGVAKCLPLGSVGLKMAQIAQGTADVYLSPSDKTQEWDACGPEAIVRAAGGTVTDALGAPLRYNKTRSNTPNGIVASNGPLHPACLKVLQQLFKGHPESTA